MAGGLIVRMTQHEEAGDRLEQIGLLPYSVLLDSLTAGQQILATCTLDDPASARGVYVWGTMTKTSRQLGRPLGWQRCDAGNLSTVLSPDGRLQIMVATGDEATGLAGLTPHTKYPRGAASIRAINDNQLAFPALERFFIKQQKVERTPGVLTWILLHRRLRDGVRWELSLPKTVGSDGVIVEWEERIIFDPVSFDPIDDGLLGNDFDHDGDEVVAKQSV